MSERRVVITGMGVVSPNGNTKEEFWKSLVAGKSGTPPSFSTTTRTRGVLTATSSLPWLPRKWPQRTLD
jgi:3-oxoacyl-(acyl-carrier-protein) synthase